MRFQLNGTGPTPFIGLLHGCELGDDYWHSGWADAAYFIFAT